MVGPSVVPPAGSWALALDEKQVLGFGIEKPLLRVEAVPLPSSCCLLADDLCSVGVMPEALGPMTLFLLRGQWVLLPRLVHHGLALWLLRSDCFSSLCQAMKTTIIMVPRTPASPQEQPTATAQPHGRPPRPVMAWHLGAPPCIWLLMAQSRAPTIPTPSLPRSTSVWT